MFQTTMRAVRRHFWWAGLGAALLSGCGGGGGDDPVAREEAQARPSYSVGGTIWFNVALAPGETGQIGFSLDGGTRAEPTLPVTGAGGQFTIGRELFRRDTYNVVVTAPVAGYTCSVTENGSGTIVRSDITNVVVTCLSRTFVTISATVSGLSAGQTTVVQLGSSASNRVTVEADGTYPFPFPQYAGTEYTVTIVPGPTTASCSVPSPVGTVEVGMSPIRVQCGS